MNLIFYLRDVHDAICHQDGNSLASLTSLRDTQSSKLKLLNHLPSDTEREIQRVFDAPWDELIYSHLKCAQHACNFNYVSAFKEQQGHIQVRTLRIANCNIVVLERTWRCVQIFVSTS